MFIDKLIDEISKGSDRTTDTNFIASLVLFNGCIAMNRFNVRNPDESKINYFTLMFAKSGQGKDYMFDLLQDIFHDAHSGYQDDMVDSFNRINEMELHDKKSNANNIKRRIPVDLVMAPNGSVEGMYALLQAIEMSGMGSFNLFGNEFLDSLNENKAILNKLKEAYDSKFTGKVIKGTKDDSFQETLTNFSTAVCLMGSKASVDGPTQETLVKLANTGFFRRAIVVDSDIEIDLKREERTDISKFKKEIKLWREKIEKKFFSTAGIDNNPPVLSLNSHNLYDEQMLGIKQSLFKIAKENIMVEGLQYDKGADAQVKSISSIVAYLDSSATVGEEHIEWAYNFFRSTRESAKYTFRKKMPQYEVYDLLLKASISNQGLSALELKTMSAGITISMSNKKFDEIIDDARMMAYQNNQTLKEQVSENMGTRYSIENLPTTNMDELIFGLSYSIYQEPRVANEIAYEDMLLSWNNISALCLSENKDSFTTCWFRPTDATMSKEIFDEDDNVIDYEDYGHRRMDNAISRQNVIVFDIDNGMSIENAQKLLYQYKYFIYTTKSHQKEKSNGEDRFRIVLPTAREFEVTPEQHKLLYKAVEEFLCIEANDPKTRNMGRLFYTNPNAEFTYLNKSETCLDITSFIPNTKKFNELMASYSELKNIKSGKVVLSKTELQLRVDGVEKWAIKEIMEGTLKDTLFRVSKMLSELGISNQEIHSSLETIRAARGYPSHFNEAVMLRIQK